MEKNRPHIAWFTPPISTFTGYGYAAVALIQALQREGVKVSYDTREPLVHISFIQPEYYSGTSQQYRIGYTPWESTEIAPSWRYYMEDMKEIWTTSKFCQNVYTTYGIESIVIPHGVDPELYPIQDRTLADKFIFYHAGGPTARKGGQRVVDAFLKLFGDDKKFGHVFLQMKSHGPSEARWIDGDFYGGNAGHHPRIFVNETTVSDEDMASTFISPHCFVYPTNGEGFGLMPFNAIATGMPTICTNATGCADFAELSIPLESSWTEGNGIHLGKWVEPDFDDLCDKMLYVYENWEEVKKKTMQSAHIIQETQTWDCIAKLVLMHLGDKIYEVV